MSVDVIIMFFLFVFCVGINPFFVDFLTISEVLIMLFWLHYSDLHLRCALNKDLSCFYWNDMEQTKALI